MYKDFVCKLLCVSIFSIMKYILAEILNQDKVVIMYNCVIVYYNFGLPLAMLEYGHYYNHYYYYVQLT